MNKCVKIIFFLLLLFIVKEKLFSEIYINQKLKTNIIVSLTSSKKNMKCLLLDNLIKSLLNQTLVPYKILLSINYKDLFYMSDYVKSWVKNNFIEIIYIDQDLKEFNKYYYIPDKYKKYIIIFFLIFEK